MVGTPFFPIACKISQMNKKQFYIYIPNYCQLI